MMGGETRWEVVAMVTVGLKSTRAERGGGGSRLEGDKGGVILLESAEGGNEKNQHFSVVSDSWSAREQRHLSYIFEFSTDIEHIAGKPNVVADALSRLAILAVQDPASSIDYAALADAQQADLDILVYRTALTSLQLEDIQIAPGNCTLLCNTSTGKPCPIIPGAWRRLSKVGGSLKKHSVPNSIGNIGSKHSHRNSSSFLGTSGRPRISLQADKLLDKGYGAGGRYPTQIFDENGKDVTPRPLILLDPNFTQTRQNKIFSSQELASSDYTFTGSVYQTAANVSFGGPFTRSTFDSASISQSSRTFSDSMDEIRDAGVQRDAPSVQYDQVRREDVRELQTDDELNKIVDVYLTETETYTFLDLPVEMVSVDSGEAEAVKKRNVLYIEHCKERFGNDRYIERMAQTFTGARKSKEIQCDKINTKEQAVMATTWDLYDSFKERDLHQDSVFNQTKDLSRAQINLDKTVIQALSVPSSFGLESRSTSSGESESIVTIQGIEETEQDLEEILKNEKLKEHLFIMERVIMENIFQPKLAAYRQLPVLADPDGTSNAEEEVEENIMLLDTTSPKMLPLWTFTCCLTKGHNVSCMVWNKHNLDLLAVGYGNFGYKEQRGGLICCWSLKNPMWPERIYHCESGVTALDFSMESPNLLAVGHYNGLVAIYNIRNPDNGLVLDSSNDMNKHIGPVWQLKWTEQDRNSKGDEKDGALISIAADGRIAKWTLAKGLESSDLMRIKRTGVQTSKKVTTNKEKKSEASISRQAPGMCFAFHPNEGNIYLAATEEGYIHKCSCSYNEQFLETYAGHKGPVYKVIWSPFSHDTFLSCSADWSIYLWSQEILRPVLRFSSISAAVHDIQWSPKSPVVFGAVNEDRVEIWDLSISILDPILICPTNRGSSLTTILFATNTDCILVGDNNGQVTVYGLENMPPYENALSTLNNIIMTTLASQMIAESQEVEEHITKIC
ncbi:dynein axonemal intermediate chain 4 isoform X2 [Narcine bancroftii]|uniref:dynein axonemal intermediate chain 4 isoform X2 n=1 Tax=Narcine bancroftii TaxID=1343680 RepID=UPI003831C87B